MSKDYCIVLADRDDIRPGEVFKTADGLTWRAVTGSVGLKNEVMPGIFVPAGMANDPANPLPDNAVTAVEVMA